MLFTCKFLKYCDSNDKRVVDNGLLAHSTHADEKRKQFLGKRKLKKPGNIFEILEKLISCPSNKRTYSSLRIMIFHPIAIFKKYFAF